MQARGTWRSQKDRVQGPVGLARCHPPTSQPQSGGARGCLHTLPLLPPLSFTLTGSSFLSSLLPSSPPQTTLRVKQPLHPPWLFTDSSLVSFSPAVCNHLSLLAHSPSPPTRIQGRGGKKPFFLLPHPQSLALARDTERAQHICWIVE